MTKKPSLTDSIKALKAGVSKDAPKPQKAEIEKLKTPYGQKPNPNAKSGAGYIPKGIGLGGARDGSGRQPGGTALQKRLLKEYMRTHFAEEMDVKIKDPKTGKEHIIKKPRIVVQLDRLFRAAVEANINHPAIKEWLDRAVGKSPQPIIGDEEEDAVQVDLGFDRMLGKAYGDSE